MYAFHVYICNGIQMCVLLNSHKQGGSAKQISLTSTTWFPCVCLCVWEGGGGGGEGCVCVCGGGGGGVALP